MGWPSRREPSAPINWLVMLSMLPAATIAAYTLLRLRAARRTGRMWLPGLMLGSLVCREVFFYCTVNTDLWKVVSVASRVSISLNFTVFAVVASIWGRVASGLLGQQRRDRPRLLAATIALVWLVDIGTLVAMYAGGFRQKTEDSYLLRTVPLSAFFALFAVLVLVQGIRLHSATRRVKPLLVDDPGTHRSLKLIVWSTIGLSLVHLLRAALFFIAFLTKSLVHAQLHLPESAITHILWPWCFFVIPETIQVILVCSTLLLRRHSAAGAGVELGSRLSDRGSASSTSVAPPTVNPMEKQGSTAWKQPLLEWERGSELGSYSTYAAPMLLDDE